MFALCDGSTSCEYTMAGFLQESKLEAPYSFTSSKHGSSRDNIWDPTKWTKHNVQG